MVTVPLGRFAYKRQYAGAPEIRLENRFLEVAPSNLREQATLLTRPGTDLLAAFDSGGLVSGNRANFSTQGLFSDDLFVVSGPNLYRYTTSGTKVHIVGLINGSGAPTHAWMKGIGYEYLFIADGLLLYYYDGGSQAAGVLTGAASAGDLIRIGTTYYSWNADVDNNAPDGTAAHPFLALDGADNLQALANLISFDGVRGVDFSTTVPGPSSLVTATTTGGPPATAMQVIARSQFADGNTIATVGTGGPVFGSATLTGGGVHILRGVPTPDGVGIRSLTQVSGYVLASVAQSQLFYWINPGEVVIDPLNFAEKESNPDNIVDMLTIGDQALLCGEASTENWYATGDADAPFVPQEGRVFQRGVVAGSPVVVKDSLILVGNDGVVYEIGYTSGGTTSYGVNRISTHSIEERIRIELRSEQGL